MSAERHGPERQPPEARAERIRGLDPVAVGAGHGPQGRAPDDHEEERAADHQRDGRVGEGAHRPEGHVGGRARLVLVDQGGHVRRRSGPADREDEAAGDRVRVRRDDAERGRVAARGQVVRRPTATVLPPSARVTSPSSTRSPAASKTRTAPKLPSTGSLKPKRTSSGWRSHGRPAGRRGLLEHRVGRGGRGRASVPPPRWPRPASQGSHQASPAPARRPTRLRRRRTTTTSATPPSATAASASAAARGSPPPASGTQKRSPRMLPARPPRRSAPSSRRPSCACPRPSPAAGAPCPSSARGGRASRSGRCRRGCARRARP